MEHLLERARNNLSKLSDNEFLQKLADAGITDIVIEQPTFVPAIISDEIVEGRTEVVGCYSIPASNTPSKYALDELTGLETAA
ncbi:MAG: hypothetical protein AAGI24_14890 [Pseudomonadota bacterium]